VCALRSPEVAWLYVIKHLRRSKSVKIIENISVQGVIVRKKYYERYLLLVTQVVILIQYRNNY
jgi:hypothetical protein